MANHSLEHKSRISDSDTMTNKLIYQIRQDQLSSIELQKLQHRCHQELLELRQELDVILQELREIAENGRPSSLRNPRIAA